MATTLEEAKKCPRCDKPGDVGSPVPIDDMPGYKALTVTCMTELCPWYQTGWIVQINPDGSIPDPAPRGVARGAKMYTIEAGVNTDTLIGRANRYASSLEERREV